ncbi:hypothetical protein LCGC14_1514170 [marine sediment metagenome]|uniref:SF4 helicase domain-containing protein n=1 Tax=marine sediment metagenome TaxID=412755 RepID=A0A0F9J0K9_9ZZZZ
MAVDSVVTEASFQRYAAILLLEDTAFLRSFYTVLKPEHMTSPELAFLVRFAREFYERHHIAPTFQAFAAEVESPKKAWEVAGVRPELMDALVDVLEDEGRPSDGLADYVRQKLEHYIQEREFEGAVRKASELLDEGDVTRAFEVVRASQRIQAETDDRIIFPTDVGKLFEYFDPEHLDQISVRTGIAGLDRAMERGLRPGELGVLMAPLKRGKSMGLVNIGVEALRQGFSIAHYSLENSAHDTLARYAANLSMIPIKELVALSVDEVTERLMAQLRRVSAAHAQAFIRWMPARLTSVDTIAADLDDIRAENRIGLVIVDYGDLARSRQRYDRNYEEQAEVFMELRDLGMQYKVPVWTATQANRLALDAEKVKMSQIAESLGKAMKADFVVAMSQTPDEKEAQEMRLNIVAARRGRGHCNVRVNTRFDLAKLTEPAPDEESLPDEDDDGE